MACGSTAQIPTRAQPALNPAGPQLNTSNDADGLATWPMHITLRNLSCLGQYWAWASIGLDIEPVLVVLYMLHRVVCLPIPSCTIFHRAHRLHALQSGRSKEEKWLRWCAFTLKWCQSCTLVMMAFPSVVPGGCASCWHASSNVG